MTQERIEGLHLIFKAMGALAELLEDKNPRIRLEAAQTVLDFFLETQEVSVRE